MNTKMLTGGCECDAVRYRVPDEFVYSLNCHCSRCRRGTGTAFKSFAGIEWEELEIIDGADKAARLRRQREQPHALRRVRVAPVLARRRRFQVADRLLAKAPRRVGPLDCRLGAVEVRVDDSPRICRSLRERRRHGGDVFVDRRVLRHRRYTAESKNSASPVSGGAPYANTRTSSSPWFTDCSTVADSTWTTPPFDTSTRSGGSPRYIVSVPSRTTKVSSWIASLWRRPFAPGGKGRMFPRVCAKPSTSVPRATAPGSVPPSRSR